MTELVTADEYGSRLVAFIRATSDFHILRGGRSYQSLPPALIDAVLQAGMSYNNVVKPRVQAFQDKYPQARTVGELRGLCKADGIHVVLRWKGSRKTTLLNSLMELLTDENVSTIDDLKEWIQSDASVKKLLSIVGIGPKTVDYLAAIVGLERLAIDVHVRRFFKAAGVPDLSSTLMKQSAQVAAKLLNATLSEIDRSIWVFMSNRKSRGSTSA